MSEPYRLLSRHPNEATVEDCKAHRCAKHATADAVIEGAHTGPDQAECGLCVASLAVRAIVVDVLTPIVLAYQHAAGPIQLSGAKRSGKVAALLALLDALTAKVTEDDFDVGAQRHTPEGKVN